MYQTVVWAVLTYGIQYWALNKRCEKTRGNGDKYAEEDAWGDKEGQTEEQGSEGENRSPGKHCEISKVIKDKVVWACGEEGREGCSEKSNGLFSDREKK